MHEYLHSIIYCTKLKWILIHTFLSQFIVEPKKQKKTSMKEYNEAVNKKYLNSSIVLHFIHFVDLYTCKPYTLGRAVQFNLGYMYMQYDLGHICVSE